MPVPFVEAVVQKMILIPQTKCLPLVGFAQVDVQRLGLGLLHLYRLHYGSSSTFLPSYSGLHVRRDYWFMFNFTV